MAADPTPVPERLVQATIKLLAEEGPSAIKARSVAAATGLSTMVVYHHFGGIPELVRAVADDGFRQIGEAFAKLPGTDDPVADLFGFALATRQFARENPHLYDLMFGLSTRATYRPMADADVRFSGRSPAFREAYTHVLETCTRLVTSGRALDQAPEVVAAQLWAFVHGYSSLELAQHFIEFDDPVNQVLLPMGVNLIVGLGDDRERAQASHEAGLRRYERLVRGERRRRARGTSLQG